MYQLAACGNSVDDDEPAGEEFVHLAARRQVAGDHFLHQLDLRVEPVLCDAFEQVVASDEITAKASGGEDSAGLRRRNR